MRLSLSAAVLAVLSLAGAACAQTVPADYAALVEPVDRKDIAESQLKARLATNPGDRDAGRDLLLVYQRFGDSDAGLPLGAKLAAEMPDDREILEARMVLATHRINEASLFSKKSAAADLLSLCEGERASQFPMIVSDSPPELPGAQGEYESAVSIASKP